MNNKAVTKVLTIIIIIVIMVAVIAGAAFMAGSTPANTGVESPVTVYINDVAFNTNLTDPQALDWGAVSQGNSYTKNFTVANNQNQPLTLQLYTTEPIGQTHTWIYNNTAIQAFETFKGTLTLTLNTVAATGAYSWRILAINGTLPTPSPSPTGTPETPLQFTVQAEAGAQNITVAINTDKITLIVGDFPATFMCKSTDTLTFKTEAAEGYLFNSWLIDGITPKSSNPLIISELQGNFTIQAKYLLSP